MVLQSEFVRLLTNSHDLRGELDEGSIKSTTITKCVIIPEDSFPAHTTKTTHIVFHIPILRATMASQTSFAVLKTKILSSLALPSSLYTDLSPKGSVDAGIRDLIANINAIEGLVTTSSCAGRISVYVEGRRKNKNQIDSPVQKQEEVVNADARVDGEEEDVQFDGEVEPVSTATSSTRASAGGKGGGGYWAFVSHDPVTIRPDGSYSGGDDAAPEDAKQSLHELFGFPVEAASDAAREAPSYQSGEPPRLVKIRFEPLVCRRR